MTDLQRELAECVERLGLGGGDEVSIGTLVRCTEFVEQHHAAIAEAVRGAERYRWLRDRWGRITTKLHMDGEVEIFENENLATPEAELLDEAIDDAMERNDG